MTPIVIDRPELSGPIETINRRYVDRGLKYGWKSSNAKKYDYGHWNNLILPYSKHFIIDHSEMPHIKQHPEIAEIWSWLSTVIGPRALGRCYVNSYTYGTDAYFHQDDIWIPKRFGPDAATETVVMYLNNKWDPDWAGETVILGDDGEITKSVLPRANRVLIFNSKQFHAARPLSRMCPVLRSIMTFKTIDRACISKEITYIKTLTENIPHSGRTFFEHLWNVASLLEGQKCTREVCLAGLFHSIYGTEFFQTDKITVTRDEIKQLIGERAEWLVHEFCQLRNRLDSIIDNTKNWPTDFWRDMIMIEYANLLDQNTNNKHAKNLERLNQKLIQIDQGK